MYTIVIIMVAVVIFPSYLWHTYIVHMGERACASSVDLGHLFFIKKLGEPFVVTCAVSSVSRRLNKSM